MDLLRSAGRDDVFPNLKKDGCPVHIWRRLTAATPTSCYTLTRDGLVGGKFRGFKSSVRREETFSLSIKMQNTRNFSLTFWNLEFKETKAFSLHTQVYLKTHFFSSLKFKKKNPCTHRQCFKITLSTSDHMCWLSGDVKCMSWWHKSWWYNLQTSGPVSQSEAWEKLWRHITRRGSKRTTTTI